MTPLTVIIPVFGNGPHILFAVQRLREELPPETEIIVSHSGLPLWFADAHSDLKTRILHSDARLYAGEARNAGLVECKTEWVAFVDEDIFVQHGWYAALSKAIERGDADCIAGPLGSEGGGYWGQARWWVEFNSIQPRLNRRRVGAGASANMAIRRDLLEKVGGFPNWRMSQDTALFHHIAKLDARVIYEPEMIGHHQNVCGFRKSIKHIYHQGRANARVAAAFPSNKIASRAARVPLLSPLESAARLAGMTIRAFRCGTWAAMLLHLPGILILLAAWNAGFALQASGHKNKSRY